MAADAAVFWLDGFFVDVADRDSLFTDLAAADLLLAAADDVEWLAPGVGLSPALGVLALEEGVPGFLSEPEDEEGGPEGLFIFSGGSDFLALSIS